MNIHSSINPDIVFEILKGFNLSIKGLHGVAHWGRVLESGRKLASLNGADLLVVEYFSIFHDSMRQSEGGDQDHGSRASELIDTFSLAELELNKIQLDELKLACRDHTAGKIEGSITVQTCWDSDRLDLWRADIQPCKKMLCTDAAKDDDLLEWSRRRSVKNFIPDCSREWLDILRVKLED